ncbi:hypothetical protein PIB30_056778 [Stylosanthes scabra]|uniref:Uncharacterized protein n=1 Tax=Stylosanthes scabra TaxID=79078 RepID=A0ABU6XJT4_9FABA|nr:hypothetical protein [Stylosanthes scabra]
MREAQKRTETQLINLIELLTKFTNQVTINPPTPSQPSSPNPLPSQPLPNPKGGINMVRKEKGEEDEKETAKLDDSDEEKSDEEESDKEEEDEEEGDEEKEGSVKEEVMEDKSEKEEEDKGETFFIATVFRGNQVVKNEIPAKCTDPRPSLITCKIRGVEVRECMCDPGTCGSVMPYKLYELLDLRPLKKTNDVFTTIDTNIVTVDAYAS